jgi:hypothetical protein
MVDLPIPYFILAEMDHLDFSWKYSEFYGSQWNFSMAIESEWEETC